MGTMEKTSIGERKKLLLKTAGILRDDKAYLSRSMALEMGKPIKGGRGDRKMRYGLWILCHKWRKISEG